jgi:anti-sigma-K factor RskA
VAASFVYKDRDALRGTLSAQAGEVARLTADAAQAHQLMDALTDPKAVRVTLTAKPTPHVPIGRATYNADKGSLIFLASNLDPLQAEKVYELWLIPTEGAPIPAGTFHPDDQGNASVIMPELPKGVAAKGFGITIEDEGGSKTPTLPIVLAGF